MTIGRGACEYSASSSPTETAYATPSNDAYQSNSQFSSSSGFSPDSSPGSSYKPKPKARLGRRQTGGTVTLMMAPFTTTNETLLMPDFIGAPTPVAGVALWTGEDPAKDEGVGDEDYKLQWCL